MAREIGHDERPTTNDERRFMAGRVRLGITADAPMPWRLGERRWPLLGELGVLASFLTEWQLWLVVLVGLVVWPLAYRIPYTYEVNFGGDKLTQTRRYDEPFTKGWNIDPEPAGEEWLKPEIAPFRWAYDQAELSLPGVGVGQWDVSILAAGQPTVLPTLSTWSDGVISSTIILTQKPRTYRQAFAANVDGDLHLQFSTPRYSTLTDRRPLGFVGFSAVIRSLGQQQAPWNQLLLLGVSIGAVYLLARRFTLGKTAALILGVVAALLLALVLARWRLALTAFTPALAPLLLACYPLGLVLARVPLFGDHGRRTTDHHRAFLSVARRPSPVVHRPIIALVVLAFAIRLGGMLHPTILFSDIGLNANDMRALIQGTVYQRESLPSELGGVDSPYPTGQYIIAAPLQLLFEPGEGGEAVKQQYQFVLKIVNALLDSFVVGLIWFVLWRRNYGGAALFAAALYVVPGSAFKSFGVGEFANLSGQAMAMPLLAALALVGHRLREWRKFCLVAVLMLFAMLGHSGVTISVVLLLGYLGVSWMLSVRTVRRVGPLLMLGAIVALLVALFFHSAFFDLFVGQQQQAAAALPVRSFGDKLLGEANRVFGWMGKPVSPLLFVLGALGVVVMALRPHVPSGAPGIWPVLVAWWGSVLVTVGLLAVRDQTVRWDLFLYPALCIGAGVVLGALWQRGRIGKLTAGMLLAFLTAQGLVYWVQLIYTQYH